MELIKSILMALLQGITEFMPVSSCGHLVLAEHIFYSQTDSALFFIVLLHVASLLAVVFVFSKDMANLAVAACGIVLDIFSNIGIFVVRLFGKRTKGYYIINSSLHRKFLLLLVWTSLATGAVGMIMRGAAIDFFDNLTGIGIGFLVNSGLMLIADKLPHGHKKIKNLNLLDAIIIGAAQGLAVLPGVSRMGIAVCAAMALGTEKNFAVKYSLISSIPVIMGTFTLELIGMAGMSVSVDLMADYLIGMLLAMFTAVITIKVVLGIIKKYPFVGFTVYGTIVGGFAVMMGFIK